jgi:8-oxo-dGTP pyrophosphatase MutT (NUDIX family)
MAHAVRQLHSPPPSDARQAGVLVLFYPQNQRWNLVLIERVASNPNDRHGGQVSFPGGRFEEGDESLLHTALREAQEEVGVDPPKVSVLGALTQLYIPVSNFLVHPFVGYTDHRPDFRPQESEVKSILEVPFRELQQPGAVQRTDLQVAGSFLLKDVPCFMVSGKVVWGATAMMLSELLEVAGVPLNRPQ